MLHVRAVLRHATGVLGEKREPFATTGVVMVVVVVRMVTTPVRVVLVVVLRSSRRGRVARIMRRN
jgi:hypothetical protein